MRKALFLFVGTVVLWYLGHFGLGALFQVAMPDLSAGAVRAVDLVLLAVAFLVSWWVMRRLDGERGVAEPDGPAAGRSDAR